MNPPFDPIKFQNALEEDRVDFRRHALEKMLTRRIEPEDVLLILEHGEIIQTYPEDRPFPSALFLGFVENRPIHVVASFDETMGTAIVITTYEPDSGIFELDFRTKRKEK